MVAIVLAAAHLLGDFVLQTSKAAVRKQKSFTSLLLHCLWVAVAYAAALFACVQPSFVWLPLAILTLSHLAVDSLRAALDRKASPRFRLFSFFVDQALHLGIILSVYWLFDLRAHTGGVLALAVGAWGGKAVGNALVVALAYLVVLQPAAVAVKKLLEYISAMQPTPEPTPQISYNVGYLIGVLERILITTLVLLNQIGGIGFVLAAKSLARFNQLGDRDFAEKYLVGTLASSAFSMLSALLLRGLLQ